MLLLDAHSEVWFLLFFLSLPLLLCLCLSVRKYTVTTTHWELCLVQDKTDRTSSFCLEGIQRANLHEKTENCHDDPRCHEGEVGALGKWELGESGPVWEWSESRSVMSDSLQPHGLYTVHGILQAKIPEWEVFPFSRGSSQPRDQTQVSRIAGRFFTRGASREVGKNYLRQWHFLKDGSSRG